MTRPEVSLEPPREFSQRYPEVLHVDAGLDRRMRAYLDHPQLNADWDWRSMAEECRRLSTIMIPHRGGEQHQGWSSITLHGLSSAHTGNNRQWGYENFCPENHWTGASRFTPRLREFVESFEFAKLARVRIMKLDPGGALAVHYDAGYGIGAINVAITNPEDCRFYSEAGGYLPFWTRQHPERARVIQPNTGYYHTVINSSGEPRYHLIIHAEKGTKWNNIEQESWKKYEC